MKILVTGRGFDGPAEHALGIFEQDQAGALMAAGHEVRFAAIDTRSLRRRRPLGLHSYTLDGLPVIYGAVPAGAGPAAFSRWAQERAAAMIWRRLEKEEWRPDVVHSHFGSGFLPTAKREGIPTVYTEHFSGTNAQDPSAAELRRELRTYAMADRLICVSRQLAQSVERNTGRKSLVVHNIVDETVFRPTGRPWERSRSFRFASAGNLYRRKGFDLLLEAAALLRQRGEDFSLTLIGGGEEDANLKKQARSLGLTDCVRFTGKLSREEMANIYRESDAFVLASRMETFGVVYIEAMAAGLPVIAACCGGPEDFVTPETGILIEKENVPALTDAMERMIHERGGYDGAAIARYARSSFSPAAIAARLTEVYEELVKC